jgi:hypothetical protein
MFDAILIARSGLVKATQKLETAARAIASEPASQVSPSREGGAITGATGSPSADMGDPIGALLDLMTAELSYKLNLETIKTASEMVRSLYDVVD